MIVGSDDIGTMGLKSSSPSLVAIEWRNKDWNKAITINSRLDSSRDTVHYKCLVGYLNTLIIELESLSIVT